MKKFLIFILVTIMLSASVIPAFAIESVENMGGEFEAKGHESLPEPAEGVLMRVTCLKKDGTHISIGDYIDLESGWSNAMENAKNDKLKENGYIAVEVTLYTDWIAEDGKFTDKTNNPTGFNWDAINVPEESTVILNLNGHTIDRGLTEWENNGEVISIHDDATVIINGGRNETDPTEGTITGGYSAQYGGGIHIKKGANVTLNNVNVVGNRVEDASGAGISVAKNATLTMNGGSISDNELAWTYIILFVNMENYGIGVYASKNSTLVFNDVDFKNNHLSEGEYSVHGAAIYTREGVDVTINNCLFEGNGKKINDGGMAARAVLRFEEGCNVEITNSVFKDNGDVFYRENTGGTYVPTALIWAECEVSIDNCSFENNNVGFIFHASSAELKVKDSIFKQNVYIAAIYFINSSNVGVSEFNKCTFTENTLEESSYDSNYNYDIAFASSKDVSKLKFVDCTLDRPLSSNELGVIFELTADEDNYIVGSIFGDGSIAVILAIASLIISILAIAIIFIDKKKNKDRLPSAEESSSAKD